MSFLNFLNQFGVESSHGFVGCFSRHNFDSADNFTFIVGDFAVLVGNFADALFQVGIFGELSESLSLFVEDLALLVDLLTSQDRQIRSQTTSFDSIFNGIDLIRGVTRNHLDTADHVTVFVEDLSLVIDIFASKVFGIALNELAKWSAVFTYDVPIFIELHTFEDSNIR